MAERKRPAAARAPGAGGAACFPEVMTIEQLAAYLHLHKQVVYRHVRRGNIPVSRIGATIRFKKSVIDAWLEDSALRSLGKGSAKRQAAPPGAKDKFVWE